MKLFLWTNIFTVFPMVCYFLQGAIDYSQGRVGLFVMYLCYALANIGIILARYNI